MNGGDETRRPSQIRAAKELLEQFQALEYGNPVDYESIKAAGRLQKELMDFLLLLGTDYQDFRRAIETMMFLRYENRMGVPPDVAGEFKDLYCGCVEAQEVSRARRLLIHVIELLGADTTEEPPPAVNTSATRTGPKRRKHEQVVAIVEQYKNDWRPHLCEICEKLDASNTPLPTRWKYWETDSQGRPTGPDSWRKALGVSRANVAKSIVNSLQEAKKNRG